MIRRSFLKKLVALPLVAATSAVPAATEPKLKILMKSACGSDDPTKAAFPFLLGDALSDAGHDVQIFLLGEAVSLMRKSVANAVVPVGWPPLAEVLRKLVGKKIPIYVCGACSRAPGSHRSRSERIRRKNSVIQKSLCRWLSGRIESLPSRRMSSQAMEPGKLRRFVVQDFHLGARKQ